MALSLNPYDPALGGMTPLVAELICKNIRERAQYEKEAAYEVIGRLSDRELIVLARWVSQGCPDKMEVGKDSEIDVDAFLNYYEQIVKKGRLEYRE